MSSPRRDEGTVLLLVLGTVVVLALLVAVVTDAARLYLARRALDDVTDAAALAGAQPADLAAVYAGGATANVPIDADGARRAVDRYVGEVDAAGLLPGFEVTDVAVAADEVTVRTRAVVHLPFVGPITRGRAVVVITSTSTAADRLD